jgi:hypothetical protein
VSFSAYARQVRDRALPHQKRVSSLRSCVQLYRPIGFQATLSFLRELAGPFERDEAALLRALDALAASRAGWHQELRRYDAYRRAHKRRGRRSPRPSDPNPYHGPGRWYGAVRRAAVHALLFWQHQRLPALVATGDPIAIQVDAYVTACLAAGGPLTSGERQGLRTAVDALRRRLDGNLRDMGYGDYDRTRQLLLVAHFVRTASDDLCSEPWAEASTDPGG